MEKWTCTRCGDAFFGIPSEWGLCIACQEQTGENLMTVSTWGDVKAELFADHEEELRVAEEQLRNEVRAYRLHDGESRPS